MTCLRGSLPQDLSSLSRCSRQGLAPEAWALTASEESSSVGLARILKLHGANVHTRDASGSLAAHLACASEQLPVVKYICEIGFANLFSRPFVNFRNHSAEQLAAEKGPVFAFLSSERERQLNQRKEAAALQRAAGGAPTSVDGMLRVDLCASDLLKELLEEGSKNEDGASGKAAGKRSGSGAAESGQLNGARQLWWHVWRHVWRSGLLGTSMPHHGLQGLATLLLAVACRHACMAVFCMHACMAVFCMHACMAVVCMHACQSSSGCLPGIS